METTEKMSKGTWCIVDGYGYYADGVTDPPGTKRLAEQTK